MDLGFCEQFVSEIWPAIGDTTTKEWFKRLNENPASHFVAGARLMAMNLATGQMSLGDVMFGVCIGISMAVASDFPSVREAIDEMEKIKQTRPTMVKGVPWKQ